MPPSFLHNRNFQGSLQKNIGNKNQNKVLLQNSRRFITFYIASCLQNKIRLEHAALFALGYLNNGIYYINSDDILCIFHKTSLTSQTIGSFSDWML